MAKGEKYECCCYAMLCPDRLLQGTAAVYVITCRKGRTVLALLMIANGEQLDDLQRGSAFKLRGVKLAISRGRDCRQGNNEQY